MTYSRIRINLNLILDFTFGFWIYPVCQIVKWTFHVPFGLTHYAKLRPPYTHEKNDQMLNNLTCENMPLPAMVILVTRTHICKNNISRQNVTSSPSTGKRPKYCNISETVFFLQDTISLIVCDRLLGVLADTRVPSPTATQQAHHGEAGAVGHGFLEDCRSGALPPEEEHFRVQSPHGQQVGFLNVYSFQRKINCL